MRKLGQRNYELIADSMRTCGFNDYYDGLMNEEQMYVHEISEITEFLKWLKEMDRPFGRANYEERFAEFKSGEKPPQSWYEVHVHFPKDDYLNDHSHIKRISGNHEDTSEIAARLCGNLDDPDYIKVIEVGGTYEKEYDIPTMKQFIEENQEQINQIRLEGYDKFPSEFF